jgi:hypothetical protein
VTLEAAPKLLGYYLFKLCLNFIWGFQLLLKSGKGEKELIGAKKTARLFDTHKIFIGAKVYFEQTV